MLLGIDSGQSALKAVVLDHDGNEIGSSITRGGSNSPAPRHVERDMTELAADCERTIRAALAAAEVDGTCIDAVGIVGHGDGMYPVDAAGAPVRPAILAVDSRAAQVVEQWRSDGPLAQAAVSTGQEPFPASLAPLASWLQNHEPDSLRRTKWMLTCKDWLNFTLTDEIATDRSQANSSVGTIDGSDYSSGALTAYGIEAVAGLLPRIMDATDVVGCVSRGAAARTGLVAGTPVAVGSHDVLGAALGSGATQPGQLSAVAGTWGVNQLITDTRHSDRQWQARPWIDGRSWILMAASPSSASNLDWFIRTFMNEVHDPFSAIDAEVREVLDDPSTVLFLPYLYGSQLAGPTSGTFLGVHAWHRRGHLLRAVMEGVVLNHRMQLSAFDGLTDTGEVLLSGGAARSALWTQMFSDATARRVRVAELEEPGCLGAAIVAGVATGIYADLADAERRCVRSARVHEPNPGRHEHWQTAADLFGRALTTLPSLWAALDQSATSPRPIDAIGRST